jgi:hypothetical protein
MDATKCIENKKAPNYNGINVELTKYAPTALHYRFLDLLNTAYAGGLDSSLKTGV